MATPPQSSPPPAAPPRSSNTLAIILLILGMIVLLAGLAVWGGIRFLTHGVKMHVTGHDGNKKEVTIQTPFGSIEANKKGGVTESALNLPIYPGARQADDAGSASVSLGFPGASGLRIVAGKFDTPDSFEKVRDFYQDRLTTEDGPFTRTDHIESDHGGDELDSGEMGNFVGRDHEGKTVFKMKRKGELRVVALQDRSGETRVELVRISKGSGEGN